MTSPSILPDLQTNCDGLTVWAKVQISASKSKTLGCLYRPPDPKISTSEELVKSDAKKFKQDHCPVR